MSYLERLKRRNTAPKATDKADKSPFVSFVSAQGGAFPEIWDIESREERAAIYEFDAGLTRAQAERLAGLA